LVPDADLRLVVETLMELLKDRRALFDAHGRWVRRSYEAFACALRNSGFRIAEFQQRKARALAQRRLGELAEARGHVAGAIAFYALALRSGRDVGCRRALARLQRPADISMGTRVAGLPRPSRGVARARPIRG